MSSQLPDREHFPLVHPTAAEGFGLAVQDLLDAINETDLGRVEGAAHTLIDILRPTSPDDVLAGLRHAALRAHQEAVNRRRRVSELTALHQIAVDLAALRDPDEGLQAIVRAAQAVIPSADATYLLLSEAGTGWNYIKASVGLQNPDFMNVRVHDGFGMVARIYETRAPLWTRNYVESNSFKHDSVVDKSLAEDGLRSVLGIPIILQGVPQGILYAANRVERAFSADEVAVLQQFADLASIAIENTQYLAGLRRTAEDINEGMTAVERAAQLHADLTALVVGGADMADVLTPINNVLPGELHLLDSADQVLASTSDDDLDADTFTQVRLSQRAGTVTTEKTETGYRHVVAVATPTAYHGALVLKSESTLTDLDRRTLQRAGHIVALLKIQQQALVEAEVQVRGDFLHELLETRQGLSDAAMLRAHSRGIELSGEVVVVAVAVPNERQLAARRAMSDYASIRSGVGGEHNGVVAAVFPGEDAKQVANDVHKRLRRELGIPALVCASRPVDGASGAVCDAFIEARRCATMLRGLGTESRAVTTSELAIFSLLFTPGREHELNLFIEHTLGPLTRYDQSQNAQLVDTVSAYFTNGLNVARTARALFVHANTVVKRLERVTDVLGEDWQDEPNATRLRVALLFHSYVDGSPVWE
ncbi:MULTISPECIES: helix-turn-helix domain-containing protein [Nocardioides]|uniref:Helix-turn-helix domain-containing protein n=1 Tax=Nocardioides vastitatis TaxID=2568655 RepID=A0ABW0ZR32_9ACTN|nr:helix-turn-helix domain-containing protein [Nocardioides sp.]THI92767.1 GAF domain-containing protein [Nocardioides sp.]